MGILAARFSPTVRRPLCRLPSGSTILGMADVVVLNDPITGQGSNTASKAAQIYMNRILAHGTGRFDAIAATHPSTHGGSLAGSHASKTDCQ
jgi:hypothetical protein